MTSTAVTTDQPLLSIVVPVYNETAVIPLFYEHVTKVLESITANWEIIFINDGSTDTTWDILKTLGEKEPRIKLISLSRNFGKEAALSAGLEYAQGQAVIPMDVDMQDPPHILPEMVAKWKDGFKVVLAVRKSRHSDSWFKRISAHAYYTALSHLSDIKIPRHTGDFRLMDQQVIEVMRLLPERGRFMKGLFAWVGFSTTEVYFDRQQRAAGNAGQSMRKLYSLARDGIIAFSTFPLQIATYVGLLISLIAISYGTWLLIRTMLYGVDVKGYASLMFSVLFMGGVQMVFIGIIGEYLGRIYNETKQRPIFIIEESAGLNKDKK